MSAAFVIVNYNSGILSSELAKRLSDFSNVELVVVVDNCSTDDSKHTLSKINGGKIKIVESQKNGGYSYGNNLGAKVCEEYGMEYCFFSNPDILIDENNFNLILEAFSTTEYIALSGTMCDASGRIIDKVQKRDEYIDDFLTCFSVGRRIYERKQFKDIDFSIQIQPTEMLHGCFFGVRLKEFLSVGGFDEKMFMYCEERLLSKKFENIGYTQGIVTGSIFVHDHQPSIETVSRDRLLPYKLMYESNRYYLKYYEKKSEAALLVLKLCQGIALSQMRVKEFLLK